MRFSGRLGGFDGTVIIAMVAVRMMEMAIDEVVGVIAVGNLGMAAIGAMDVRLVVFPAGVVRGASGGIGSRDAYGMFLDAALAHVVEMAVVEIIDMAVVVDADVAATGSVLMIVGMMVAHDSSLGVRRRPDPSSSSAWARAFRMRSATCRSAMV